MRWWGLRDLVVGVLVMTLAVGTTWTTVETAEAQSEEAPEWLDDLVPATSDDDPVAPPAQESEPAPLVESEGTQAAEVTWPSAGSSIVTLAGEGEPAATQGGLVEIAPGTDAVDGDRVEVRVLGHDVAQQVGVSGFLFELSGQGESVGELGGRGGLPAEVAIDYAGFEHAYGAGYLDRLHVVALPRCVLEDPRPDDCGAAGVTLPTRIDARAGQVVASIADVGALMSSSDGTAVVAAMPPAEAAEPHDSDGEVVFAVTSGPSGETGNFGATPLSASGDWQVAPGSGEFSYSYPLSVPAPPAGDAPDVGLAYSSGAVDGMVSTRNTQSPMSGVGWGDFAGSFVERRYESCADTVGTGDLCWKSDNATIHLNGRSSEMVKRPDGTWLLKNDPGWKVERLTGASNGDDDGEHWKVTTPDGVQYFFGLGRNPDVAVQTTSSAWYVPVWADHAGEPCRAANNTLGGCNQAWRWNLDRVVDPNGMATTYFYSTAMNWYLVLGGLGDTRDDYIRGGHLERIEYGKPVGTGTDVSPAGRVLFERQFRCAFLVESCPGPTRNSDTGYPDVPVDLLCNGADDTACLATTPTFFTASRYSAVRTEVYYGGDWHKVDQWNLSHTFLENSDGDQKLYLTAIQRVGLSQSGMLPLPAVNFWPVEKPNRVDVNLAEGRRPMGHFRVDRIVDEYGHETRVNYGQKSTCPATKVGPSIRWDQNTQDCFPQKVGTKWATFHKYLTTRVDEIDPTGGSPTMTTTYTYEGTAAWHHEDDEFVSSADQSWSDWRGYHTTRIRQGASDTRIRVFRGMRGDRQQSGGPRDESLTSLVDSSRSFFDEPWLAGTVLEEASYGALGEILQSNLYEYEVRIRAQVGNDPQDWAWRGRELRRRTLPAL